MTTHMMQQKGPELGHPVPAKASSLGLQFPNCKARPFGPDGFDGPFELRGVVLRGSHPGLGGVVGLGESEGQEGRSVPLPSLRHGMCGL